MLQQKHDAGNDVITGLRLIETHYKVNLDTKRFELVSIYPIVTVLRAEAVIWVWDGG